jgi:hypothetical protein
LPFCITTTWFARCAHDLAQIVADEHVGEVAPLLQVAQQVDDLRLHDMSSAEVGSSSTTNFGSSTMARAIAMRWRWPPENSCG